MAKCSLLKPLYIHTQPFSRIQVTAPQLRFLLSDVAQLMLAPFPTKLGAPGDQGGKQQTAVVLPLSFGLALFIWGHMETPGLKCRG